MQDRPEEGRLLRLSRANSELNQDRPHPGGTIPDAGDYGLGSNAARCVAAEGSKSFSRLLQSFLALPSSRGVIGWLLVFDGSGSHFLLATETDGPD